MAFVEIVEVEAVVAAAVAAFAGKDFDLGYRVAAEHRRRIDGAAVSAEDL